MVSQMTEFIYLVGIPTIIIGIALCIESLKLQIFSLTLIVGGVFIWLLTSQTEIERRAQAANHLAGELIVSTAPILAVVLLVVSIRIAKVHINAFALVGLLMAAYLSTLLLTTVISVNMGLVNF